MPRPVYSQEILSVIKREMRKQKIKLTRASAKVIQGIAEVAGIIQKKGLPDFLVCKKLEGDLGSGIFLHPDAEPLKRGQVISSYAGAVSLIPQNEDCDGSYSFMPLANIVLSKEEQQLHDPKKKYHPKRLYTLKIDALKTGNFTRFINHSEKPNVEALLMTVPRNVHGVESSPMEVVYCAKKTIHPGEQLLVCYEDEEKSYWGVLDIKPFIMLPKTFQINSALKVISRR